MVPQGEEGNLSQVLSSLQGGKGMKKRDAARSTTSRMTKGATLSSGPTIAREREQLYEIDDIPLGGINDLSTGEVKRFLSSIVKTLSKENEKRMVQYIDTVRNDLVGGIKSIRDELHQTQSNFQLRLEGIEADIQNMKQVMEEQINAERNKRLILTKKVYKKLNSDIESNYKHLVASTNEIKENIGNNSDEIRTVSKDILVIRENLDELLLHRFGYIPSSSLLTLDVQEKLSSDDKKQHSGPTYDATTVLETLATRVKHLEGKISTLNRNSEVNYSQTLMKRLDSSDDEEGLFGQEEDQTFKINEKIVSKSDAGIQTQPSLTRNGSVGAEATSVNRLEELILELKADFAKIQAKVDSVESVSLTALSLGKESMQQKARTTTPNTKSSTPDSESKMDDEMKRIQKKLKALSENSSNAVKSLAAGLHDVHETTLKIYKWGSGVSDAFQIASTKMGFKYNICPNLIDEV